MPVAPDTVRSSRQPVLIRCRPEYEGALAITDRELEVLRQAGRGRRNKEIGTLLGISVPTVKNHLGSALLKLKARSRTEAVVRAVQLKMLTLDELDPTPLELAPTPVHADGRAAVLYRRSRAVG